MVVGKHARRFFVGTGAVFSMIGVIAAAGGAPPVGIGVMTFGIAALIYGRSKPTPAGSIAAAERAHVEVYGQVQAATVIMWSRTRTVALTATASGLALSSLLVVLYADAYSSSQATASPEALRFGGACGAVVFLGAAAVGCWRLMRPARLALTREALLYGRPPRWDVIPWDAIGAVRQISLTAAEPIQLADQDVIEIEIRDYSRIRTRPGIRMLLAFQRAVSKTDYAIPSGMLVVDGEMVCATLAYMVEHPADRPALADPGGAEVLRRYGSASPTAQAS